MQSFVILFGLYPLHIPPVVTETIIAWDRLYRRGVRTVNLVAVRFMFICVDSTAFVNYVNMAFAIKISRLMITSIMYHRLTLVLLYLQTKSIIRRAYVSQISSKSACIISARFSQLNNQTSNQLFKCNFGFAFRSSLVIIDKENVNLITYL